MIPQAALRLAFLRGIRAGLKGEGPALVGESWAEDDPALPRLEARAIGWVVGRWRRLRDDCLAALGLAGAKAASKAVTSGAFRFTTEDLIDLIIRSNGFAAEAAGPDGPLIRAFVAAWARGWTNAGRQINATDEVAAALAAVRASIANRGLELVRGGVARTFRDGIVAELSSGALDGVNPVNVAAHLRRRFGAGEYNWERLARTEIATAQSDGKLAHYRSAGITHVDYVTAGDDRVSAICQSLAARGPYAVASAPVPGRDSHPNCRCTLVARIPD
ncbi:MAG: minor capsid protein [Rhodospirillales bacterium]